MRSVLVLALLLGVSACGGAPPPPPAPIAFQRDLSFRLETDRADARVLIDGKERLQAMSNRTGNVLLDLKEGTHQIVVAAKPSEYGGLGLKAELVSRESPLLTLTCAHPCDDERLAAWAATHKADTAKKHSASCVGLEVSDVRWKTEEEGGALEVTLTLNVEPPIRAAELAARGCPVPAGAAASPAR
jgi:hypothetical protein